MRRILYIILFLTLSGNAFGTAQIPDILIYNGDTLSLYACPLASYPEPDLISPRLLFGGTGCFYTACWRNYVATWEVINNELYLVEIRNACYPTEMRGVAASAKGGVEKDSIGKEYADLKELFPQRFHNGKVKADWVNGKLYAPQGRLMFYIHDGFQSIYETELALTFKDGILMECQKLDNSKTKKSKYMENPMLLREYVRNSVRRENLPASDSVKRRVYIHIISADDNGKIDSVKVARGVNELYDKEAIRVIKSIPEWEVLYRHGKRINRGYTIPVIFDLTEKKD